MKLRRFLVVAGLLGWASVAAGQDIVVLQSGRTMEGLILDHKSNQASIRFRTEPATIPVVRSSILRIATDPNIENRYWIAREYLGESLAGHLELAQWCKANGLAEQSERHLHRALGLDETNQLARDLLGYRLGGKRLIIRAHSQSPAFRSFAEKRREQLAVLRKEKVALAEQNRIKKDVVRWVSWLRSGNPDRETEAIRQLGTVSDPIALGPLTDAMRDADYSTRQKIVDTMARIPGGHAALALAIVSVIDLSPEIRGMAIESLKDRPQDSERYLGILHQSLKSRKPALVHHGADALVALNQTGSTGPLIGALKTRVRTQYKSPEVRAIRTSWVRSVRMGTIMDSDGSKIIPLRCPG